MPDEDKTIRGFLVLDLRIWWRHVHTLHIVKLSVTPRGGTRYKKDRDARRLAKWNKSRIIVSLKNQ